MMCFYRADFVIINLSTIKASETMKSEFLVKLVKAKKCLKI